MSFKYNTAQRVTRKVYRKFFPVQKSSYRAGYVEDTCSVHLVSPEDFKNIFYQLHRAVAKVKGNDIGDYFEFGVFNGASLSSAYMTFKAMGQNSSRFFGFDAFQGLPAGSENEDDDVWKKGFYACSFDQMQECLRRKNINSDDITWVQGWYDQTLNQETMNKHQIQKLGIAFIDCDTYSSSKSVLNFIRPLITEPVILCFDDWKLNDLDIKGIGEYKSFNEFLGANSNIEATEVKSYNRKSRSFLVKPKS